MDISDKAAEKGERKYQSKHSNFGRGYIHGFCVPNARNVVASMDSVDRTPEVSLRSRIP
jgi:hypothetical protein